MNDKLNQKFKAYAGIKLKIKALEDQAKALQPVILAQLKERTKGMLEKNLRFDYGTFTIAEKRSWGYSPVIIAREAELKKFKEIEEETGIAKATVSEFLKYQQLKEGK